MYARMIKTVVVTDAEEFVERAMPVLMDEAMNNLIPGIASRMALEPGRFKDAGLFLVEQDDRAAAAALIIPPYHLLVCEAPDGDAIRGLARVVHTSGFAIPGVSGSRVSIESFNDAWCELTGATAILEMEMGVFSVETVHAVPDVVGDPRRATMDDIDLVVEWMMDVAAEAFPGGGEEAEWFAQLARRRLEGVTGSGFWFWEVENEAVAISGQSSPTGAGIRINSVYTPPARRRNGCPTALDAYQSQWLLGNGYRFCCQYTDLASPTSNAIYRRIGYHQVAESTMYGFS
jgi:predicted GNAT family acetyltransferase